MRNLKSFLVVVVIAVIATSACRKPVPVTQPAPPPSTGGAGSPPAVTTAAAPPVTRVDEPLPVPAQPESIGDRSLDDINRNSPLQPAFFTVDSAELDQAGRNVVTGNAEIMKRYPSWIVTVEGHCDERGTAEYNLSLGERRADAVKSYLVSLGIPADRVRTVSYGKEFPFDGGHDDGAWSKNRRAHFVITSK